MADITRQDDLPLVELRMPAHLARAVQGMQVAKVQAIVAMDQVSEVYEYGLFKTAVTLAQGELIKQLAAQGGLSPTQQAARQQLSHNYLHRMGQIADNAGAQITRQAAQMSEPTLVEAFIDGVNRGLGRY